ncbi:MAG TPA: aminopeptidase [Blastocatellia bacterium]|nr:aminopeptidase [Blastocatellia bacterium]
MKLLSIIALALLLPLSPMSTNQTNQLNEASHDAMARRIVESLRPARGERVILRFDPETLPALEPKVRRLLEDAGAVVETLPYGAAPDLEQKLANTDIYVWLPAGPRAATPPPQAMLLGRWLDSGRGRQVHFHWGDGTRALDGLPAGHSAAYDRVYLDALDIDYRALDRQMDAAIGRLRSGDISVTTPAGTDLRFRVGDRPFTKQTGDASKERMKTARVRIDREIELPAGALRVAPIETSVNGVMVIPSARIGGVEVTNIRLEFKEGTVTRFSAGTNEEALKKAIDSGPGLKKFREIAIGFNPKLVTPGGERWVAYYGYGAGVVRLGLGDNSELGGSARGFPIRWLFFADATVRVAGDVLVDKGRLLTK